MLSFVILNSDNNITMIFASNPIMDKLKVYFNQCLTKKYKIHTSNTEKLNNCIILFYLVLHIRYIPNIMG